MIDLQPRYDLMEKMLHEGEKTKRDFCDRIKSELGVTITPKAVYFYIKAMREAGIIHKESRLVTAMGCKSTRESWYRLADAELEQEQEPIEADEYIANPVEIDDPKLLAYMGIYTGIRPRGRACISDNISHGLTPIRHGSYGVSHVYQGGL